MAEKKRPSITNEVKEADEFSRAYMRLRTVLDGLEISSLQYALKDKNVARRIKRIGEIEELVMPVIRALQDRKIIGGGGAGACGEGYFNCGGVCVPYQCPGGSKS
jgi:hypothetical protein